MIWEQRDRLGTFSREDNLWQAMSQYTSQRPSHPPRPPCQSGNSSCLNLPIKTPSAGSSWQHGCISLYSHKTSPNSHNLQVSVHDNILWNWPKPPSAIAHVKLPQRHVQFRHCIGNWLLPMGTTCCAREGPTLQKKHKTVLSWRPKCKTARSANEVNPLLLLCVCCSWQQLHKNRVP